MITLSIVGNTPSPSTSFSGNRPVTDDKIPSDSLAELEITNVAANKTLPNVTIANTPSTAVTDKVNVLIIFRTVLEDNQVNNMLDGNQYIQVSPDGVTWTNCILLVDNAFDVELSTKEGGTIVYGNIDVKAIVTGNGTYQFRWASAVCDADGMTFNDIQVIIRRDYHY